jgi:hypothetical protein
MIRKAAITGLMLWLGTAAHHALAAERTGELFVDRLEVDDYSGLIYSPIVSRFSVSDLKFKVTVPIVRFMSAPSAGYYTEEVTNLGRPAGTLQYAELGDITAKVSRRLWRARTAGTRLDASGKLTFATGDASKDIGDGRAEATLVLDIVQPLRAFEFLGGVSYSARHSYTDDAAANGFSGYAGVALNLGTHTYFDATYEYEQASEVGDPSERTFTLALNHSARGWTLRSFAAATREARERELEVGFAMSKKW